MNDKTFGLKKEHIESIHSIFSRYPNIEKVIVYGSRAQGNYKKGSDIDLVIIGDLNFHELIKIDNEIDDLLLPYKMDISLYHTIDNPELLNHIHNIGKIFYENNSNNPTRS